MSSAALGPFSGVASSISERLSGEVSSTPLLRSNALFPVGVTDASSIGGIRCAFSFEGVIGFLEGENKLNRFFAGVGAASLAEALDPALALIALALMPINSAKLRRLSSAAGVGGLPSRAHARASKCARISSGSDSALQSEYCEAPSELALSSATFLIGVTRSRTNVPGFAG